MPRKPTKTVRIDMTSHDDLKRLSRQYSGEWKRHISVADIVRMGITSLMRDYERRKYGPQQ
jgi:hypothetical protein